MLFERIRRTQKPIFVFLAIVFGLGFVLLGVGSGAGGVNLGDLLGGGSSGSSNSISSLQSTVGKNPKDARAWLQLAQQYSASGQNDQAISAYQSYIGLKPKDINTLSTAAGLLEQRASINHQNALAYQNVASYYQNSGAGAPISGVKFSTGLSDPLATGSASTYQETANALAESSSSDYKTAMGYRQTIQKTDPKNAFNLDLLGYDAAGAQDYAASLAAFQAFLKVASPSSSEAQRVHSFLPQLEQLVAQQATAPSGQ
ncbi:MAG TPA: tetratricopeptide repeat protein [Gaiellales bacterium]|jgi:tetratricopeptide (TPR) repeat protein|nr:tetratricopeptide repeat protein [Gaiellales bacterium]